MRRAEAAMKCARLLIVAYTKGEANGGTIEWEDLNSAYEAALEADPQFYIEALAKAHEELGNEKG